jgi:flagella basal body P-ring formation protein FlgA
MTAAEQVPKLVDAAARRHVLRMADSSGLVEPKFELTVVPGSRPLSACGQAVTVDAVDTRLPSRMRFAAVCPGADGWRYEFVVRAQLSARVAVAATDVPAGRALEEQDVALERHDISTLADVISDTRDVVGMSGKRSLRAGEVLRATLLTSPILIKRGDPVRMVAKLSGIEVSMAGEAMDAGGRGAVIRVRNSSGNIVRTRITAMGTVEPVDGPGSTQSP